MGSALTSSNRMSNEDWPGVRIVRGAKDHQDYPVREERGQNTL